MRSKARQTTDIWPGFVDALATLLILIIFVLLVFVLGQFFLAQALSGRDAALEILSGQVSELAEGISQENAKKIIADVKKLKLKIQIKIQGEELRAQGKKRDDLQEAISAIEAMDIGLPIEFINFRD